MDGHFYPIRKVVPQVQIYVACRIEVKLTDMIEVVHVMLHKEVINYEVVQVHNIVIV